MLKGREGHAGQYILLGKESNTMFRQRTEEALAILKWQMIKRSQISKQEIIKIKPEDKVNKCPSI